MSAVEEVIDIPQDKLDQLVALFELYDLDGSGYVSADEIIQSLTQGRKNAENNARIAKALPSREHIAGMESMPDAELAKLVGALDKDGNNELDLREFVLAFKDVV